MRKLFMFCAAMLMALAVNAATVQVSAGTNTLRTAITDAAAGDILELVDGIFYEEGNFDFTKSLTIRAAENAHPIVANRYYFRIEGGAQVTFQGIEFDGSIWVNSSGSVVGASDHCMCPYNSATGTEVITVENCKFHGYSNGYIFYTQRNSRKWHALIARNCAFHNNQRCIGIIYESSSANSCDSVVVENCTFESITGNYAPIYVANGNTTKLSVDHCTFYNNAYHCINVGESVTNTAISNCIFANGAESTRYSATCLAGTISNCLSFNTAGFYEGPTITACITGDPLFVDAANGDFTLGTGSPALTAATDGGAIGDLHWAPHVQVLEDGYYLIGRINGDSLATWTVADLNATRLFEANPAAQGEYMLTATLAAGDELQVVQVAGDAITNWFPGGEGNNYVVDANHAGEKTIYFRPDRQGASDWHMGCIFIAANGTNINNVDADVKAVKFIMNGKVFIRVNGENYTVLGQKVAE